MPAIRFIAQAFFRLALVLILAWPSVSAATTVRLQTTLGVIDIELFDTAAPQTVANFLNYVNSGAYVNSLVHRSVPGFVIQGGGYTWDSARNSADTIPLNPPVVNEFSASRSNLRGTIAMAKLGGDPNSATSQWFINLANNAANLDNQNGGFTVFGRVTGNGMAIVDAIAALPLANAGGPFDSLPLATPLAGSSIQTSNVVLVTSVRRDSDRVFAYLEATYPQYMAPAFPGNAVSATASPYYYRYYPATTAYLGTSNGVLYYLGPASGNQIFTLGPLTDWLTVANGAGF